MERNTSENIKMTARMAMECSTGLMVVNTMVSGEMANSTAVERTMGKMERLELENGLKASA